MEAAFGRSYEVLRLFAEGSMRIGKELDARTLIALVTEITHKRFVAYCF